MTQQQIDTMTGILEGREFAFKDIDAAYRIIDGCMVHKHEGAWKPTCWELNDFIRRLLAGKITLVPQPPEPLSDEMGELLYDFVCKKDLLPCFLESLESEGLIQYYVAQQVYAPTQKGKYLLGQWLMEKNKGAANV